MNWYLCDTRMIFFLKLFILSLFSVLPRCCNGNELSESQPRVIGTNHEPGKIIAELTSGNSIHPGNILTLSLVGALAVITSSLVGINPGSVSKRRSEAFSSPSSYVENIHNFENAAYNKIKNQVSNSLRRARIIRARTSAGFGNVVNGMARVGNQFGYGLGRLGRVLSDGTGRGLRRAFWTVRGVTNRAGRGLRHFVRRYNNGFQRLSGAAYLISKRAGRGVSRMGTVASSGFSRIGNFAADSAVNIFNAALGLPLSLATAAKERAVQDCLIQTVCYISTPILTSRKKRMITSVERSFNNSRDLESKYRKNDHGEFKMEDCEVFECRLASLGRKALGVFSKMKNTKSETP